MAQPESASSSTRCAVPSGLLQLAFDEDERGQGAFKGQYGEQRQQQRQQGTRVGHKRARDDEREGGCRVGAGVGGGSGVRGEGRERGQGREREWGRWRLR